MTQLWILTMVCDGDVDNVNKKARNKKNNAMINNFHGLHVGEVKGTGRDYANKDYRPWAPLPGITVDLVFKKSQESEFSYEMYQFLMPA